MRWGKGFTVVVVVIQDFINAGALQLQNGTEKIEKKHLISPSHSQGGLAQTAVNGLPEGLQALHASSDFLTATSSVLLCSDHMIRKLHLGQAGPPIIVLLPRTLHRHVISGLVEDGPVMVRK